MQGADLPIEVHVGRTAELIAASECTMAVSGSVSLELLYHAKPSVILYYISRLAFFVQSFFRKVRYITLVNLLVTDDLFPKRVATYDPQRPGRRERVLMPEYLTCEDKSPQVAEHVIEWLTDPAKRRPRELPSLPSSRNRLVTAALRSGRRITCSHELDRACRQRCWRRIFRSTRALEEAARRGLAGRQLAAGRGPRFSWRNRPRGASPAAKCISPRLYSGSRP